MELEFDQWVAEAIAGRVGARRASFERALVDAALAAMESLSNTQGEQVLLHQDLHGDNVLSARRQPWLAIDPKPLVGERELSLAPIIRSYEFSHSRTDVVRRLDGLSTALLGWGMSGLCTRYPHANRHGYQYNRRQSNRSVRLLSGQPIYVVGSGGAFVIPGNPVLQTQELKDHPVGAIEPTTVVFSRDGLRAYIPTFGEILVLDVATAQIIGEMPVAVGVCGDSGQMAIGPDGSTALLTSCVSFVAFELKVLDLNAGTAQASISVPGSFPSGVAFSPDGAKAYVVSPTGPNQIGTVSIVDPKNGLLLQELAFRN